MSAFGGSADLGQGRGRGSACDQRRHTNSTIDLRFGRFKCPALSDTDVYLVLALVARFVVKALPWTYHNSGSFRVVNSVSAASRARLLLPPEAGSARSK